MIEDNLNTENGNVEGYDNPENYGIGAGDIISSMDGDVDNYGGTSGGDCFGHNSCLDDGYGSLSENGSQSHSLTNDEVQAMSNSLKNHMHNLQIAFEGNEYTDAEMEYAFCDNGSTPDNYWFTDGLHPTAAGYVQKIVPAIKNALDGKDQPTIDDNQQQALLDDAKDLKMCQLYDYDEFAYHATEWQSAKAIYEAAVKAINDCTTVKHKKISLNLLLV